MNKSLTNLQATLAEFGRTFKASDIWGILALSVLLSAPFLVQTATAGSHHFSQLLTAISIDILITFPIFLALFLRGRSLSLKFILPGMVWATIIYRVLIPSEFRDAFISPEFILFPLELFIVFSIIRKARQFRSQYVQQSKEQSSILSDPLDLWRSASAQIFSNPKVSEIFAQEIATFHYAFGLLKSKHKEANRSEELSFSQHKKAGYGPVLFVILMAAFTELFAVHLLLADRWPHFIWVLSILSAYSILFVWADYRAHRYSRITLGQDELNLRVGLRIRSRLSFDKIKDVELLSYGNAQVEEEKLGLKALVFGTANVRLHLMSREKFRHLFGIAREADYIDLFLDDPESFRDSLLERIMKMP